MIAYIDSSLLLRIVLEQPEPLAEWPALSEQLARAARAMHFEVLGA